MLYFNFYILAEEKKAEISENANVDEIDEMIKNLKMTIDQQKEKRYYFLLNSFYYFLEINLKKKF